MPEAAGTQALLRLTAWLSPAFPVGSFSYSHGLERAVHDALVEDAASLRSWIGELLDRGSAWNDAVLFAEAWRRGRRVRDAGQSPGEPEDGFTELAELGIALAGSAERLLESATQGGAFGAAMNDWGGKTALPAECPYCVTVGAHAGAAAIPLEAAIAAFLQAFASNQLQAGIRLGLIGQSQAVRLLAGLEPQIAAAAARAARSTPHDLGTATLAAEIAAMRHETQYSRLFRT
jgi:urease accessory protein